MKFKFNRTHNGVNQGKYTERDLIIYQILSACKFTGAAYILVNSCALNIMQTSNEKYSSK